MVSAPSSCLVSPASPAPLFLLFLPGEVAMASSVAGVTPLDFLPFLLPRGLAVAIGLFSSAVTSGDENSSTGSSDSTDPPGSPPSLTSTDSPTSLFWLLGSLLLGLLASLFLFLGRLPLFLFPPFLPVSDLRLVFTSA